MSAAVHAVLLVGGMDSRPELSGCMYERAKATVLHKRSAVDATFLEQWPSVVLSTFASAHWLFCSADPPLTSGN